MNTDVGSCEAGASADCAELSRKTQEELNMSWDVTLLDLASKLAGKTPGKTAAER